ncbi:hypothetical protein, partial [Cupriavidus sp. CuC1]|uniref:hypothetical protein n=1 Tax=Cupriavidus sp. CuC1 TaxID=3373131 RepID=UPI0037D15314
RNRPETRMNARGSYPGKMHRNQRDTNYCRHKLHPKQALRAEIELAMTPFAVDRWPNRNPLLINRLRGPVRADAGLANRRKLHRNQSYPEQHNNLLANKGPRVGPLLIAAPCHHLCADLGRR